jgi:hypothetical protein
MEAARVLVHSGHGDYQLAKHKAAHHLGATETRNLPSNVEIEQALVQYQHLFNEADQRLRLVQLRKAALQAMKLFACFRPRLVGSLVSGAASMHAVVELHLFADTAEEVIFFLLDRGMPFEEGQRRICYVKDKTLNYPVYRFMAEENPIELLVMPSEGIRQAPLSPVDGKPMRRISMEMLEALMLEHEN